MNKSTKCHKLLITNVYGMKVQHTEKNEKEYLFSRWVTLLKINEDVLNVFCLRLSRFP